jgi:hypothetical protein
MDRMGLRLCPMAGFDIGGDESLGSITRVVFMYLVLNSNIYIYIYIYIYEDQKITLQPTVIRSMRSMSSDHFK